MSFLILNNQASKLVELSGSTNSIHFVYLLRQPIITLIGSTVITLQQNQSYIEYNASATDTVDGDISGDIVITGSVDTATIGTYYKYYNVENSIQVPAIQKVRTIIVESVGNIIVELFGDANYNNPTGYSTVYLSEVRGYDESELLSLGVAMGSTASLSSLHIDAGYIVTIFTGPGFTGDSQELPGVINRLDNLGYYPLPPYDVPQNNFQDKTRSLIISIL